MISNLKRFQDDLGRLIDAGENLLNGMQFECFPEEFIKEAKKTLKGKTEKEKMDFIDQVPSFKGKYQDWYSESLVIIKQILPDRLADFVKLYEKPKIKRKEISFENYVIEDYLQGLRVTRGWDKEVVVSPSAAIPLFTQQLNILKSTKKRFESSLFDIQQIVQADLFDSELETAKELNERGFVRAAGAVAGVVLEKHLNQVCISHDIQITKKHPTIADYNDALKKADVIELAAWRKIQHLGDIRNQCDHGRSKDPSKEDVEELIEGISKVTKTIF